MATVTLITPTGGRPDAWALCERWIKRQTYRGDLQWIVVDDMSPPTVCTLGQEYYRGPRLWSPGVNTHRFNMELALSKVEGEFVMIIEDDDYYAPTYIEQMVACLIHHNAVGIGNAKYYHVGVPGHKTLRNYTHAALAHTAFRAALLPTMQAAVQSGDLFFDRQFWQRILDKTPNVLLNNSTIGIGIKGLPGRPGITESHRQKKDYFMDNIKYDKLVSWIGHDIESYRPFLRSTHVHANSKGQTKIIRKGGGVMPESGRLESNLQRQG